MKNRFLRVIATVLLALFIMPGCAADERPAEVPVPEIPEDYLYLASENVYLDYASWEVSLAYIPLISAFPLTADDITIKLDQEPLDPEQYALGSNGGADTQRTMPFYVYQIYRGKDWAAHMQKECELHNIEDLTSKEYKEAFAALEESRDEFLSDYLQLQQQGRLPVLYSYMLSLFFPEGPEISQIHEITLCVKGRELSFPLGEVRHNASATKPNYGTALSTKGGDSRVACEIRQR